MQNLHAGFFRQKKFRRWAWLIAGLTLIIGLALAVYQIPSVQHHLDWRIETALVFLRTLVQPIQPVPTPVNAGTAAPILAQETDSPAPEISPTATLELPTPTSLPESVVLEPPPFEVQDWNNCGPVTLSMFLHYYGWQGDQYTISDQIKPLRDDRNVNVTELVDFVNTGAAPLSVIARTGGDIRLLRALLNGGFPVMIEKSMLMEKQFWKNDDLWAGHYLLLTGYDDAAQNFIVQDAYIGPDQSLGYAQLNQTWQPFNRIYLVVYPPEREQELIAILGENWDVQTNRINTLRTARQEASSQPRNPFAWFNLGTSLADLERFSEAAQAYDQSRTLGIPQRMLRYQFGPFAAYYHSDRIEELLTLTDYALTITPNSEEALLWQGWALYRSDKTMQAIEAFQKALQNNPNFSDARSALQYVQGQ